MSAYIFSMGGCSENQTDQTMAVHKKDTTMMVHFQNAPEKQYHKKLPWVLYCQAKARQLYLYFHTQGRLKELHIKAYIQ